MVTAAESNGRHLAIAHQMRYHHSYRIACDLVTGGFLCEVRVIQVEHLVSSPARFGPQLNNAKEYRFARAYGGGTIMDMGVHEFGIRYILGRSCRDVRVRGAASFPGDMTLACVRALEGSRPIRI